MVSGINVNAQSVVTMTNSGDTVVNTGTKTVNQEVRGWYETVNIQVVATKISGTVAGTMTLQGSNDGSNYSTIDTAIVKSRYSTFTATDVATQTTHFVIEGSPYRYYRVSWTGSGTMSARIYGYVWANE